MRASTAHVATLPSARCEPRRRVTLIEDLKVAGAAFMRMYVGRNRSKVGGVVRRNESV